MRLEQCGIGESFLFMIVAGEKYVHVYTILA